MDQNICAAGAYHACQDVFAYYDKAVDQWGGMVNWFDDACSLHLYQLLLESC